jgi:hypothetical protein
MAFSEKTKWVYIPTLEAPMNLFNMEAEGPVKAAGAFSFLSFPAGVRMGPMYVSAQDEAVPVSFFAS